MPPRKLVTGLELEPGAVASRLLCQGICSTRNVDENQAQSLREQRFGSTIARRNLQPFSWWFSRSISIEERAKRQLG